MKTQQTRSVQLGAHPESIPCHVPPWPLPSTLKPSFQSYTMKHRPTSSPRWKLRVSLPRSYSAAPDRVTLGTMQVEEIGHHFGHQSVALLARAAHNKTCLSKARRVLA